MSAPASTSLSDAAPASPSLVSLLGEGRATIVQHLRHHGEASVAQLAGVLGISEVATRRHLAVLADDELVEARTAASAQGRGRPPARYHLTPAAARLFPQRYDRFAEEVLEFLADTQGRDGLKAFLRWRLERQVEGLRDAVTAEDLHGRLEQLAGALSAAGFEASVRPDDQGFTLTQRHCAIYDVAKQHPEVCAYEAATFSQVLGRDVKLSRRQTLAGGAPACVCSVAPRDAATGSPTKQITDAGPNDEAAATTTSTSHPRPGDDQ